MISKFRHEISRMQFCKFQVWERVRYYGDPTEVHSGEESRPQG